MTDLLFESGARTGGLSDPDVADLRGRLANLMHRGLIVSVNLEKATAIVQVGEVQTAALPWLTNRAGGDCTWWAPEVGEQVVVICPCGNLSQGAILGSLYRAAHPAPASSADQHVTKYGDGTTIIYDRAAHALTVQAVGAVTISVQGDATISAQNVSVTAQQKTTVSARAVSMNAQEGVTITGDLSLQGNLSLGGEVSGGLKVAGSVTASAFVRQPAL